MSNFIRNTRGLDLFLYPIEGSSYEMVGYYEFQFKFFRAQAHNDTILYDFTGYWVNLYLADNKYENSNKCKGFGSHI